MCTRHVSIIWFWVSHPSDTWMTSKVAKRTPVMNFNLEFNKIWMLKKIAREPCDARVCGLEWKHTRLWWSDELSLLQAKIKFIRDLWHNDAGETSSYSCNLTRHSFFSLFKGETCSSLLEVNVALMLEHSHNYFEHKTDVTKLKLNGSV